MQTISLDGAWTLTRKDDRTFEPVRAQVPGSVHAALVDAGRIPDPLAGANLAETEWVGAAPWVFTRTFDVDDAFLEHGMIDLEFDGLDTLATATVNGHAALRADNAFRTHRSNVRDLLKPGRNRIAVTIRPATAANAPHKPRFGFGTPYAPALVTAGIFRSVRLRAWDVARIEGIGCSQRHGASGPVQVFLGGWIERAEESPDREERLHIRVLDPDGTLVWEGDALIPSGGRGAFQATATIRAPRLWWPAGMGPHPLYSVIARLTGAWGKTLDETTIRIGLRTLEPESGTDGRSRLLCNGRPLFLRGAVWTPPHPYRPLLSRIDYEPWIANAVDGCFNALRLSSAAPLEGPDFWDLCDENGLVVLGTAALGAEASAEAPDTDVSDAPPFLRHACVPDTILGEPDEESGLVISRGIVSYPSSETLAAAVPPSLRNPTGPCLTARTSLRGGPSALLSALVSQWPVPPSHEGWLRISQLAQAAEIRSIVASARLSKSSAGFFWEPFVSAWAAADASSVDAGGRPKALQYEAARFFAPEALFGNVFRNDLPVARRGLRFGWRLTTLEGTTLAGATREFMAAPASSTEIPVPDLSGFIAHFGEGNVVLWFSVLDAEGFVVSRDFRLFAPPKDLRLVHPGLSVDVSEESGPDGEQVFRMTVAASAPAFGVTLETPGIPALFSDGAFALEPDETYEVLATPISRVQASRFRAALRVRSLYDESI